MSDERASTGSRRSASGFGSDAQTLRPFSGLQDGFVKLS